MPNIGLERLESLTARHPVLIRIEFEDQERVLSLGRWRPSMTTIAENTVSSKFDPGMYEVVKVFAGPSKPAR